MVLRCVLLYRLSLLYRCGGGVALGELLGEWCVWSCECRWKAVHSISYIYIYSDNASTQTVVSSVAKALSTSKPS